MTRGDNEEKKEKLEKNLEFWGRGSKGEMLLE